MPDGQGRRNAAVRAVNCPNCGAATAVRTFGHAVNVVCQSCRSILDATDPGVTILQKYNDAVTVEPLIPLGTRGTVPGWQPAFEVVGFQVREITVDQVAYRWREYLLFNPYHGFRYLTEYNGHWNVVATLRTLPEGEYLPAASTSRRYQGRDFRHFQKATATTVFVLGEFPWQVRVGDQATVVDYVAPPQMLSAEVTAGQEVTWSLGEYATGTAIWAGLALPGRPPAAEGIFANQPSPYPPVTRRMWRAARMLMVLAVVVWIAHLATARGEQAFSQALVYDPGSIQDPSLVTPAFELDGRPSATRIEAASDVDNQWMDLGYALINDHTGQAFAFTQALSYYHGVDEGESWSEGSPRAAVTLPSIPPGRYFLRIEPEGERSGIQVRYTITVVRDVATSLWFIAALALILLPPAMTSWRAASFEQNRWQESDGGDSGSSATGSSDDDD